MQQTDEVGKQRIKLLQIVCGILSASTLVHLYLAHQAVERNQVIDGTPPSLEHPMVLIFAGVSLLAIAVGILLPNFMLKSASKRHADGQVPFNEIFPPNIIRFALFEAVSILGFLVASPSRDMNYSYAATGVALICFVAFFPTESRVAGQMNPRR